METEMELDNNQNMQKNMIKTTNESASHKTRASLLRSHQVTEGDGAPKASL